jgi:hypothetical protein
MNAKNSTSTIAQVLAQNPKYQVNRMEAIKQKDENINGLSHLLALFLIGKRKSE